MCVHPPPRPCPPTDLCLGFSPSLINTEKTWLLSWVESGEKSELGAPQGPQGFACCLPCPPAFLSPSDLRWCLNWGCLIEVWGFSLGHLRFWNLSGHPGPLGGEHRSHLPAPPPSRSFLLFPSSFPDTGVKDNIYRKPPIYKQHGTVGLTDSAACRALPA